MCGISCLWLVKVSLRIVWDNRFVGVLVIVLLLYTFFCLFSFTCAYFVVCGDLLCCFVCLVSCGGCWQMLLVVNDVGDFVDCIIVCFVLLCCLFVVCYCGVCFVLMLVVLFLFGFVLAIVW